MLVPTRVLAVAFGLVMVASVSLQADGLGLVVAVVAASAVVGSVWSAPLAGVAVVSSLAALALSDAAPIVAALTGLTATCYLVVRHSGRAEAITLPTMVSVLGASALGLLATSVPVNVPWLPLAAPFAVLGAFVIAVRGLSAAT